MNRKEQIKAWVKEYELGYYFNPGGIEFFCPAFPDINNCHCGEYVGEEDEVYNDEESFIKLSKWIEDNEENFKRDKPKEYTYYSEGVYKKIC